MPIPGADVLGRGIYIRPRQPYELKDFLLAQGRGMTRLRRIGSVGQLYSVPAHCEVNDSPPLPPDQSTGQTVIEESWSHFGREFTLDVNLAASGKVLNIDATAFQGSNLRSETDSYYALRSSFIPLWSVYMPRVDYHELVEPLKAIDRHLREPDSNHRRGATAKIDDVPAHGIRDELHLPEGPFDPINRACYARIFDHFGTHYVKSAWLGGKASLIFVIAKSSQLTKAEVRAGIEATFAGIGMGKTATTRTETQERVRSNSSCKVFGSGGDPTELAKLTKLDSTQYDNWVKTVKDNPETIQFSIAGIWTLLHDEAKAEALRQAYVQESTFTPLTVAVPIKDWFVFAKEDTAFDYAKTPKFGPSRLNVLSCLFKPHMILEPERLRDKLTKLFEGTGETSTPSIRKCVEQVTQSHNLSPDEVKKNVATLLNRIVLNGEPLNKVEPFSALVPEKLQELRKMTKELLDHTGLRVVLLNRNLLEDFFPDEVTRRSERLSLLDYLPALRDHPDFQQPHAAFSMYGFGTRMGSKLYLFRWRMCLRIDIDLGSVDAGYPKAIADEWSGVNFDRIDAAVSIAPDRIYFFRAGEYIRLSVRNGRAIFEARDLIKNRWPGVIFDNIDTAVYWGNNKIYFFSDDQYIRYDLGCYRADPGYPKFVASNYVEDWEFFV
jgi:hypothetical protein